MLAPFDRGITRCVARPRIRSDSTNGAHKLRIGILMRTPSAVTERDLPNSAVPTAKIRA